MKPKPIKYHTYTILGSDKIIYNERDSPIGVATPPMPSVHGLNKSF